MKTILKLLFVIVAAFFSAKVMANADMPTVFIYGLFALALCGGLMIPVRYWKKSDTLNAITQVSVFNKYIIEKFRRTLDWLVRSRDESQWASNGATVYIPNAGSDPGITVDRSSFPASATQRTDNDVNYVLKSFSSDPQFITTDELAVISYDKIDSVIGSHMNSLAEAVGDQIPILWAPTTVGQEITTTGDDTDPVGNQAGTRKGFKQKDLAKAMVLMNTNDVPKSDRVAIIDDNMYGYFYDDLSNNMLNAFNQFADNATGRVGRLHGFDIYTRSSLLNYAAAATSPNAYAAAQLATDNLASLCYQKDQVTRAVGETKFFAHIGSPLYYGNVYSALVRLGGRKVRTDNKGVVAIIQGQ